MSESEGLEMNGGKLQDFTIDQFAGALALSLGAVGTLLLVIWQSRCACKCRLGFSDKCYIFDCSREPPPIEVAEDPDKDKKDKKQDKILKKEDKILQKENEILKRSERRLSFDMKDREPEPEPELLPPENP
tara:strand:- start:222 stop:614 length:393 start_codon:yes stop_codon:yes gene_type:complete